MKRMEFYTLLKSIRAIIEKDKPTTNVEIRILGRPVKVTYKKLLEQIEFYQSKEVADKIEASLRFTKEELKDLKAIELYRICKSEGIMVVKRQPREYYLRILIDGEFPF